jgi:hypothetical protein
MKFKRPVVEVQATSNSGWQLVWFPSGKVEGTYRRLLDAVVARQYLNDGVVPPFERWVVYGVQEVTPVDDPAVAGGEQVGDTGCLNLRDWEYEEILIEAGVLDREGGRC